MSFDFAAFAAPLRRRKERGDELWRSLWEGAQDFYGRRKEKMAGGRYKKPPEADRLEWPCFDKKRDCGSRSIRLRVNVQFFELLLEGLALETEGEGGLVDVSGVALQRGAEEGGLEGLDSLTFGVMEGAW